MTSLLGWVLRMRSFMLPFLLCGLCFGFLRKFVSDCGLQTNQAVRGTSNLRGERRTEEHKDPADASSSSSGRKSHRRMSSDGKDLEEEEEAEGSEFPITMPFSSGVPQLLAAIRRFIHRLFDYGWGMFAHDADLVSWVAKVGHRCLSLQMPTFIHSFVTHAFIFKFDDCRWLLPITAVECGFQYFLESHGPPAGTAEFQNTAGASGCESSIHIFPSFRGLYIIALECSNSSLCCCFHPPGAIVAQRGMAGVSWSFLHRTLHRQLPGDGVRRDSLFCSSSRSIASNCFQVFLISTFPSSFLCLVPVRPYKITLMSSTALLDFKTRCESFMTELIHSKVSAL